MVEKALAPFALLDMDVVVIGIGVNDDSSEDNIMVTRQTSTFYLTDFKADEAESEVGGKCRRTSCDCQHEGDGL